MGDFIKDFGIEWPTILFALFNLIILVVVLYFAVVRPVKKIMAKRKADAEAVFTENEKLKSDIAETQEKYAQMTAEAEEKIQAMTDEAKKAAEENAAKIVADAKAKSLELMLNSVREIEKERARMEQRLKGDIASMAVDIASKVLERDVTDKDNSKLVDEALSKWSS